MRSGVHVNIESKQSVDSKLYSQGTINHTPHGILTYLQLPGVSLTWQYGNAYLKEGFNTSVKVMFSAMICYYGE